MSLPRRVERVAVAAVLQEVVAGVAVLRELVARLVVGAVLREAVAMLRKAMAVLAVLREVVELARVVELAKLPGAKEWEAAQAEAAAVALAWGTTGKLEA